MKNHFETNAESELALDEAYDRAQEVLGDPIDMTEFTLYKDVGNDVAYVKSRKESFAKQQERETEVEAYFRKMAKIFEAIVFDQIERSNWLGESAMTIQASDYDDIHNGVDTIVEFEEEDTSHSHLALAIDVTTSQDSLNKKLDRIKREIESGSLTQIKYFYSESIGFRGEKTKVPRVVIGAEKKTISDLVSKWMDQKNKELAEHIVQVIILEQIRIQLEKFKEYAETIKAESIAKVYDKALIIINKIREEKNFTEEQIDDAHLDSVTDLLGYSLGIFNKK